MIAGAVGVMGEVEAALVAARATIERHEAAAREHSDERAGLCAELARVRGLLDDVAHAHERGVLVSARIYTAAEAKALREAAPAGPYEACHPDDLPGRSLVSGGREVRPPYDAFCVGLEDRVRVALAELFAASPDLAATVEAQAAEIATLSSAHRVGGGTAEEWKALAICNANARNELTGELLALRDAAREYLDAEKRQLTHSDLATWRESNAARTRLAALVGGV